MYDIKIFLEENGKFGARVNIGKDVIYGLGNSQEELISDLKQGMEFSQNNKSKKASRLYDFLDNTNNQTVCH